ncbi:MAG: hypothetical protein MUP13_09620, partial [Thermoanaerobaculales bacterium]|nr:hypothetical protein [Thermoanaerobaculales bacterium]
RTTIEQAFACAVLDDYGGEGMSVANACPHGSYHILPSVRSTARFIWGVAAAHLVFGVVALGAVAYFVLGFGWIRSLFHGLMIFFAGFDTGGFAPQSTSVGYYHSALFEFVALILMVAGALSFAAHFALWHSSSRRALLRNLEARTILITSVSTLALVLFGLAAMNAYDEIAGLSRQGLFQVVSAHTGTGFATVPPTEMVRWRGLAFAGMAIAMALGGMASSTAGGIKAMRVGLTATSLRQEIQSVLLPHGAIVDRSYFQFRSRELTPALANTVLAMSLLYITMYFFGAVVGVAQGVPLQQAAFESVSAGANVGLSVGVTDPSMSVVLEITYIIQMWLGRLEFVAAFAFMGFLVSMVRGK